MASDQPGIIEPYDVMQYERSLTEFLAAYCSDEELQKYPISDSLQSGDGVCLRFISFSKSVILFLVNYITLKANYRVW